MVEADGQLAGMITLAGLDEAAFDRSHDDEWTAKDVTGQEPALLALDDDLMTAVNLFDASGEAHLPVVRDRTSMTLVGMAHEHRVLTHYHRAVIRAAPKRGGRSRGAAAERPGRPSAGAGAAGAQASCFRDSGYLGNVVSLGLEDEIIGNVSM